MRHQEMNISAKKGNQRPITLTLNMVPTGFSL